VADASTSETTDAKSDLAARLVDEYKILQDKIDKIGAFRFTIKGWSVTVIIASIFAGSTTKTVPRSLWAISLMVFLFVFFLFELQQTNLRHRFGHRVLAIEEVLSRLLRNLANESGSHSVLSSFLTLRFVPGIGHLGTQESRRRRRRPRNFWRSCVEADVWFYFVQALVVATFVFWPGGGAQTQDHASSQGTVIINASPVDVGGAKSSQPAQVISGRENEKDAKKNTEHQSH
jgi:hypothetical protein